LSKILILLALAILVGCGKSIHPKITHRLPEINLDTLCDSSLTTERLISYLRDHSLQDSEWENSIGEHYIECSPIFIRGFSGNLSTEYYVSNGSYEVDSSYVAPTNPHRSFVWTSERTPNPIYSYSQPHGKGTRINTGQFYFEGFPLIFSGDSIVQNNWPLEQISTWSRKQIFDSLVARLGIGPIQSGSYSAMLQQSGGFTLINKDSAIIVEFFTQRNKLVR
jgi:hypothetical protein